MATKKEDKEKEDATNEEILQHGRDRFRLARLADKVERELCEEDIRFAINDEGCQWDKEIRNIRESAKPPRPCLVMNKIPEKIDQAEGEFRQLRPTGKVTAVDSNSDPKIATIIGGIIRHIEYNSMARSAYATAYGCTLNGGRGAWRIDIVDSLDDPFEQDIVINRIPNPLSVTVDPAAKRIDKSDGNFVFVHDDIDTKAFKTDYPDISLESWPNDDSYHGWKTPDTVRIVEYWWKEPGKKTAYRVERAGTVLTVWEPKPTDRVITSREVNHPKVKWCKMVATKIIEGPVEDWPGKYLPIIYEVGKETNVNGVQKTRGMVRFGKEPQKMYNYWTSAEAEQITTVPKTPYLMTPKMMGPHQTAWDLSNISNFAYLFYEHDPDLPGQGPRREQPIQMSTAMIQAKQGMEHDIMSGMNVYRASLGDTGQEISGTAINARKQQGSVGGFTYVDNFEYALTYSYKVLIDLIPALYGSERIMRIRGDGGKESLVAINARKDSALLENPGVDQTSMVQNDASEYINDITIGKYDIAVSIGASYTTQRQESLDTLIKVLEIMPDLAAVSGDLVVSLLDMPMSDDLLARAKKLVPTEIRGLDPGEEPPAPQGPTLEEQFQAKELDLKFKTLELKGIEEMRKGLEGQIDGIAKIMTAEAKEQGNQLNQISAFISAMKDREQGLAQQRQLEQAQPQEPQQGEM